MQDSTARSFIYPLTFRSRPVIMVTGWYNQVTVEDGTLTTRFTYRINDYLGNINTGKGGCAYVALGVVK